MEDAYGLVRHVQPVDEDPVAGRIESDVAGEREAARRTMHRGEPLESGVVGRSAAAGETHDDDPRRIDPRMLAEDFECAVRIADVSPAAELVLVVRGVGDAAAGEAVDDEGRDAEGGEFARPVVLQPRWAARGVEQDHSRQSVGAGAWMRSSPLMVAGLASFFPVRNSCSVGVWV